MTRDELRGRIAAVCTKAPFKYVQAKTPFSFDLQPTGEVDQVFRLELDGMSNIGGFNLTEERTDRVQLWLARKHAGDSEAVYRKLLDDSEALRAAVIRDGAITSGEYTVPDDGAGMSIQREPGKEFAVLRLTMPVNYEVEL